MRFSRYVRQGYCAVGLATVWVVWLLYKSAALDAAASPTAIPIAGLLPPPEAAWKDDWIRAFITRNLPTGPGPLLSCPLRAKSCTIPKYIPPRGVAPSGEPPQKIPRVIWQTWKSTEVGPVQFRAMASHILLNPEYEYVFFDDSDAERFICEAGGEAAARAYATLVPGAAKADVWRLTIVLRYGGVYLDSDSESRRPLREFLEPESNVASSLNGHTHLDQWALLYTPRHPFVARALQRAVREVAEVAADGSTRQVVALTGPWSFNAAAQEVMRENSCLFSRGEAPPGLVAVNAGSRCPNEQTPNAIGQIQVIDGCCNLGENIVEITRDVFLERRRGGYRYYTEMQNDDATLFRDPGQFCAGYDMRAAES